MKKSLFGISIDSERESDILEKIQKYLKNDRRNSGFYHIVSLNPENMVCARGNAEFGRVLQEAEIRLIDGAGVKWAARLILGTNSDRITGVDLMKKLLKIADENSLTIVLIGGKGKVAEKVVECQKPIYPRVKFIALEGIRDIKNPQQQEEERIFSIVADTKPHFIFVAFGSPAQELWLDKHKGRWGGAICMGVGGAFDFLSGAVPRAPRFMRELGFEWLFRLISQPWRLKRQSNLIKFVLLIIKEKLHQ